jgi:hypothetical protein
LLLRLNSGADLLKSPQPLKYFANFLVFLALLVGCEAEHSLVTNAGAAYFPLQTGVFQVYTVHEIIYSASEAPQESNYELMTEVTDSFPSANGLTYVIHRRTRQNDTDAWQALDTWSVRKDDREIIVSEGNSAFVKMKFPLHEENVWDGNVFNSLGRDDYAWKEIAKPAAFNGMTFEKTLTVEQEDNEDPIVFRDERKEVYAMDIGLVYKEIIQLNYCTADACLGQQKIDHGQEVTMVIREYGKN